MAGLSLPGGFARRVTFDAALRSLTDTNATGQTTTATWRPNDLPIATRDAAGRVSTTVYDALDRPVAQYGPAPASCFTDGMKTAVLADNPKAYWRLGETAGPQAADTSGNGRTATYVNTTLGVAGAVPADSNGAAYFNGNNSYLNLPDVLHGTAAPTVELWFNTTVHRCVVLLPGRRPSAASDRACACALHRRGRPAARRVLAGWRDTAAVADAGQRRRLAPCGTGCYRNRQRFGAAALPDWRPGG